MPGFINFYSHKRGFAFFGAAPAALFLLYIGGGE